MKISKDKYLYREEDKDERSIKINLIIILCLISVIGIVTLIDINTKTR